MAGKYRINIEGEEHVVDVVERGEKDYLITLNGKTYQTHIEDARGSGGEVTQPMVTISPASAPASVARTPESKLPSQKPSAADAGGAIQICAPLTGTVTSIKVISGAKVERGQLLCLLEAMKMEIEVSASQNGVIVTAAVKPSDTVQQGALLFVLHVDGGQ
jgi:glutaconyl-CoA/methylmalonyl-CoA decarboxylase subunit gamma